MTLNEFVNNYNGTTVGDGQCVYLIRKYIEEVLNLEFQPVGNAHQFYDDYENNDYLKSHFDRFSLSSGTPVVGDIVVWSTAVGGGAGHVAIAYEDIGLVTFKSFDQNWNTPYQCNIENHSYANVLGWLRKKGVEPVPTVTTTKKKYPWIFKANRIFGRIF